MFCPGCGLEELQSNQFCRSCGTDMRVIRTALAMPDSITASAASAREEIGRAVAAKIRETKSAKELAKVTEEVLPEIEKFLESPAEKRLRRMRTGMLLSAIGMGTAIGIGLVSMVMNDEDVIFLAALGLVTFFIGLGFILNGVFLTVPKRSLQELSPQSDADDLPAQQPKSFLEMSARADTNDLFPSSVTEHTTKHLKKE